MNHEVTTKIKVLYTHYTCCSNRTLHEKQNDPVAETSDAELI